MKLKSFGICLTLLGCCGTLFAANLVDLGAMIRPMEYRNDGTVLAMDMNDQVPFIWDNGKCIDLPELVNTGSSLTTTAKGDLPIEKSVLASNGRYQVGWISDDNIETATGPTKRAAMWTKYGVKILPDAGYGGCARAVSEKGWVAGYVQTQRSRGRAALWIDGRLTMLPDDGLGYSEAFAINYNGQVAGSAVITGQGSRAVVWGREGRISILNKQCDLPEGWNLREATCINDDGDVAGMATVNGLLHGFVLR